MREPQSAGGAAKRTRAPSLKRGRGTFPPDQPEPRLAVHPSTAGTWTYLNSGEQLCLACGLCCDGTLFEHVRLCPDDDANALEAGGLPVRVARTKPHIVHSLQPCAALCADGSCRVYALRPAQCRAFECGVYADFVAGRISAVAARRLIKNARQLANRVLRLLRQLGDREEALPLAQRFRRTAERMECSVADPDAHATFAELGQAFHRLNLLAHDKFYTRAGKA